MFDDLTQQRESPFAGLMRPRARFTAWRFYLGLTPQIVIIVIAVLIQRNIEVTLQITRAYMQAPSTAVTFLIVGELVTAIVLTILLFRRAMSGESIWFAVAIGGAWVYAFVAIFAGYVAIVQVTGRGIC